MNNTASSFDIFRQASVLVTGGCGFIGSHLVESLVEQGARVIVVDNMQAGLADNLSAVRDRIRLIVADVRDPATYGDLLGEQPRFVFHLAANASVPGSVEDPAYDFQTNASGTFELLNALRRKGKVERFVLASSGAVYGEPKSLPIREDDPTLPISPYGASKLTAEIIARMMHRVYGVPTVVARLFNSYGPRMARFVILDFLRKLQRDPLRLEILGSGCQVRDFTYISDTVEGLLMLAAAGTPGEAYNLSSGRCYSVTELARIVVAALGLSDTTKLITTGKSWVGDAQRWEVSIDKLYALGYRARVSLQEGVRNTIDWFVGVHGPIMRHQSQNG